jgi:IS4 transposase
MVDYYFIIRYFNYTATGILYLASNDLQHDADYLYQIYQKRWKIEVYHKSIKQNTSLAKSPTKKVKSQANHIFASIVVQRQL